MHLLGKGCEAIAVVAVAAIASDVTESIQPPEFNVLVLKNLN